MTSIKNAMISSTARHAWIEKAAVVLRARFVRLGYQVPGRIRVSVGFPKGSRGGNHLLGQCWGAKASADGHFEVFITPELSDGARIMDVLAHEFVHAVVGVEAGHKAQFKSVAEVVGLTGKMTATVATEEFDAWARAEIRKIGPYPAGGMRIGTEVKKQSTRLLKCQCDMCGYTARVTAKWLDLGGAPICPTDEVQMICDTGE